MSRISGPLLDRIDLHVEVTPVPFEDLRRKEDAEPSSAVRERVERARDVQAARFANMPEAQHLFCNAQMSSPLVRKHCALDDAGQALLKTALVKLGLSARAHDRILKVARTIADLAGEPSVGAAHVAEAVQYRSLDRAGWGMG